MKENESSGGVNETETFWRGFMKKHLPALTAFMAAAVLAFAWAVYVFWWFAGDAQSTGLVPGTIGFWTMGNLISFMVYAIIWELILVGVPVAIGGVIAWRWWKRLPDEGRGGFCFKRSRSVRGGGGVSFLILFAFCIKVYVDGNWNVPVAAFSLNYVVSSVITILLWGAVIFGIPATIALAWWLSREAKIP